MINGNWDVEMSQFKIEACAIIGGVFIMPSNALGVELPVSEGSTFIEQRFTITQPFQIGYVVESILRTVDRLGIDIKLAAMRFGPLNDEKWFVEYGSAIGDHKKNYEFQNLVRSSISLTRQNLGIWRDVDCSYTLTAFVSFLGIEVFLGPVHAFHADITFDFTSESKSIHVFGNA